MSRHLLGSIIAGLWVCSISLVACQNNHTENVSATSPDANQSVASQLVLKAKDIDDAEVQRLLAKAGHTCERFDVLSAKDNIYLCHFNLSVERPVLYLQELADTLSQHADIVFAEPNQRLLLLKEPIRPKDTYFLSQWGLHNIGQDSPDGVQGRSGADVGASRAWMLAKGSRDVVVGIIDTGIDYEHPDLRDNIWRNEAEIAGVDGVDDDGNGYTDDKFGWNFISAGRAAPYYGQLGHPDPKDDNGHGTHCAGVIGATPNNFQGVAGVNWQVRLMGLKFLSARGSGNTADAFRAVRYAIDQGVDVLSNSWGSTRHSKLLEYIFLEAEKAGIVVVAAAGNSGSNNDHSPHYPSSLPLKSMMAVAATDINDNLAGFSSYGASSVHIAAPGVSILSTIPTYMAETPARALAAYSGTSMAAPFVAGAAALLIGHDPQTFRKQPMQVKERLMQTATVLPQLSGKVVSQGRLNLHHMLLNRRHPRHQPSRTVQENIDIVAPRYNQEHFDKMWTLTRSGAGRIRVYFDWLMADIPKFDLLALYDKDFNLAVRFETSSITGFWSPWIEGDTLHIRFANAWVQQVVMEQQLFASTRHGYAAGATQCSPGPNGKVLCMVKKRSQPYANFESEGFAISQVEYQFRADHSEVSP